MNNLNIIRLLTKTRISPVHQGTSIRMLEQLVKQRPMSTSIFQNTKEREVFHDTLPGIIDNLISSPKISQLPEVGSWIKTVLEHNLSGGKQSRGLMTMFAYEMLEQPENITEEYLKLSRVLGWCIEIIHAYFLVLDDIMDASTTRRGMRCWYLMPNVGMGAINDAVLITACLTETLETYFLNTPHYVDLVRLFHEAILFTSMGQHLDFTMAHNQAKRDYSMFTMERHNTIAQYKTSYYSFKLPILLGLTLVKDVDKKLHAEVTELGLKIGNLFQMQDDYIDCYGDEALSGKAGTDIQEGKCSWLAVTALQHCNETQRELFKKYYSSAEPEHVAIIKNLYNVLHIPELYKQAEIELYNDIVRHIQALPSVTAPKFLYKLLEAIYKRNH